MKKSIKLTLGLLGISAISAITVGSVISCSNDSSMVSTNSNNSSNSNNTNKSSSTNSNSSNDTSFIPYSDLTKTVTKEPSFNAALANWTNDWKKLTANPETYLTLITNDVNACLSDFTEFANTNPFVDTYQSLLYSYDWLINNSYSNVQISLNKNNTFNISYDCTTNIGYKNNNESYLNVIQVVSTNKYSNVSFKPCLLKIANKQNIFDNKNSLFFGGEETNIGSFSYEYTVKILSNSLYTNSPSQAPECPYGHGNIKWLYSFLTKQNSLSGNNLSLDQQYLNNCSSIFPIWLANFMTINGKDASMNLISSYENGINYGELSVTNNK